LKDLSNLFLFYELLSIEESREWEQYTGALAYCCNKILKVHCIRFNQVIDILLDRQPHEQSSCSYPDYIRLNDSDDTEEEKRLSPAPYLVHKTLILSKALKRDFKTKAFERVRYDNHNLMNEDEDYLDY
jgi:hypothetical protein